MLSRRPALLLGLAAAGALLLSGCDKPAPSVTVWSGQESTREEALCWAFDAEDELDAEACAAGAEEHLGSIEVKAGNTIGISVDHEIAENGWIAAIGENRLTAKPITETYYRFALNERDLSEGVLELRVLALNEAGEPRGLWAFELEN